MPVDTTHKHYDKRIEQWKRCRDTVAGTDAVKGERTKYLPWLTGQDDLEYGAYLNRALFFNASERTVKGLTGAVFRKQYNLDFPESKKDLLKDITDEMSSVDVLLRKVVHEVVAIGRTGCLVDVTPEGEGDPRTYITQYRAENILNWTLDRVNGAMQPVFIALREAYEEPDPNDKFAPKHKHQIRTLVLENGVYMQRIYRKRQTSDGSTTNEWAQWEEDIIPKMGGKPLDFIPFKFINSDDDSANPCKPPLLDLVDVNLSHYRTSADLEHGAHFTALPTPVLSGFDVKKTYRIGSGVAWVTDNPQGRAVFLEYTGQGLRALQDIKADKEAQMAVLGARMLEQQKKTAETAETHRLRGLAESGPLAGIVGVVEEAMTAVFRWYVDFIIPGGSASNNIDLSLNKDFVSSRLTAQEITALMTLVQGNHISQDTFLHNLKEGEVLPDGTTIEEEKDAIETDRNTSGDGMMDAAPVTPLKRSFELVKDQEGKTTGIKEA